MDPASWTWVPTEYMFGAVMALDGKPGLAMDRKQLRAFQQLCTSLELACGKLRESRNSLVRAASGVITDRQAEVLCSARLELTEPFDLDVLVATLEERGRPRAREGPHRVLPPGW